MQPDANPPMPSPRVPSLVLPETTHSHASKSSVGSTSSSSPRISTGTARSAQSRKEHMASLVVPSPEKMAHISQVQAGREAENKKQKQKQRAALRSSSTDSAATAGSPSRKPVSSHNSNNTTTTGDDGEEEEAAARTIQRVYRGYRTRRQMKGLTLDPSTRWTHAIREAKWRHVTAPRARDELNDDDDDDDYDGARKTAAVVPREVRSTKARMNWRKAAAVARRAVGDEDGDEDVDVDEGEEEKEEEEALTRPRKKEAKTLDLLYFLEMVDLKHRCGANLRVYHEEWKRADTNENFFYWLDRGEGRRLDVDACPRAQLDRERVRYLSREDRQYYLVEVDAEGRLCWAKNGARIDTTERWKDSVHGIVLSDDPTPAFRSLVDDDDSEEEEAGGGSLATDNLSTRAQDSQDEDDENNNRAKGTVKVHHHASATTLIDKLLRRSVQKNTWIFVADTSLRLYVGIKASGAFQHSSFLQGSRISAAGLIRIQDGHVTALSPLSGHYRPPASNFRAFVRSLGAGGVDMRRVSISKSYAILSAFETCAATQRRGRRLVRRLMPHRDGGGWRRRTGRGKRVEGKDVEEAEEGEEVQEEQAREENRVGVRMLQALRIKPREPAGQRGD